MIVSIQLDEGEPWKYGGITFAGNHIYTTEELNALVTQQQGEIFSLSDFNLIIKVSGIYTQKMDISFTTLTYDDERDETTNTILYNVSIIERDRAYIENIIIRG